MGLGTDPYVIERQITPLVLPPPSRAEFDALKADLERLAADRREQKEATLMMARGIENLVVLYSHIHDALASIAARGPDYPTESNTIEDI